MTNHAEKVLPEILFTRKESKAANWTIRHIGAGVGLLGGLLILFGASFLVVFEYIFSEKPHGSYLFFIVLPLWIFGAHCFDKIEEAEKAARLESVSESAFIKKD